ncbi:hypothetical protein F2Q70_00003703 [Brassica cretica]|uniref:Uncharacterized protein n=1 Tax=Brassica cretica TaxID=69181 RepID=A0A8S9IVM7_BRACR|nr:hypothetical protein F2Q70_00003703 [Brassica cretica]
MTARVFKSLWNSAGLRSTAVSTAILPHMCAQLRWYYILVIGVYASVLAFGNMLMELAWDFYLRSEFDLKSDPDIRISDPDIRISGEAESGSV